MTFQQLKYVSKQVTNHSMNTRILQRTQKNGIAVKISKKEKNLNVER